MIDEDEVGLKEKPEDTRYINKRPIGLIAPPFKINFLATENWPKMRLKSVRILRKIIHLASGSHIWSFFDQNHMLTKSKSRSIASQITNLASRKSYLVIILPNSYQKLTKIACLAHRMSYVIII